MVMRTSFGYKNRDFKKSHHFQFTDGDDHIDAACGMANALDKLKTGGDGLEKN